MSQRNPLNDRYTTEEHKGKTRKSAASAKPKTKAASSVRIQPAGKTKEQKKAEQKARRKEERAKQRELDSKYYSPPTPRYTKLRRAWWILLVGAIVCTVVAFVGRTALPTVASYVILGLAYALAIGAIVLDFTKIRKERDRYQREMESDRSKEARAAEKQQKAAERDAKRRAAEQAKHQATEEPEPEPQRPTLKGFSARKKKQEVQQAQARAAARKQAESEDAQE